MNTMPTFTDLEGDLDAEPVAKPTELAATWEEQAVKAAQTTPSLVTCPDCRGTGRFYGYSGRYVGPCFKCSGTGKSTAPKPKLMDAAHVEARAKDKVYREKVK